MREALGWILGFAAFLGIMIVADFAQPRFTEIAIGFYGVTFILLFIGGIVIIARGE